MINAIRHPSLNGARQDFTNRVALSHLLTGKLVMIHQSDEAYGIPIRAYIFFAVPNLLLELECLIGFVITQSDRKIGFPLIVDMFGRLFLLMNYSKHNSFMIQEATNGIYSKIAEKGFRNIFGVYVYRRNSLY